MDLKLSIYYNITTLINLFSSLQVDNPCIARQDIQSRLTDKKKKKNYIGLRIRSGHPLGFWVGLDYILGVPLGKYQPGPRPRPFTAALPT